MTRVIYVELTCPNKECGKSFEIDSDTEGVVTCPHCGIYVEG